MRPNATEVLHFSEDPTITKFVPHVAHTSSHDEALVWAVDYARAPDYWFPRQCPRAMAWVGPNATRTDQDRIIGAGCGERVHAIEYDWLTRMQSVELYAYRLPAARFRPFGTPPSAHVSAETIEPLGPAEPVRDLLGLHWTAGIQLRLLDNLWDFWDEVVDSTLEFSGIRLRNAEPRPQ